MSYVYHDNADGKCKQEIGTSSNGYETGQPMKHSVRVLEMLITENRRYGTKNRKFTINID